MRSAKLEKIMKKTQDLKKLLKRKFIKGDLLYIKAGYYYPHNEWLIEKSMPPAQKPIVIEKETPCKFVKNSPEGPSYKIVELSSGEHIEVLTVHIEQK